ncbi:MAG: NAD(P)/FAD-dependent oxidoreductase, partial [Gemmatimonadota bacterium]|nr:NAD(P)/FAD-dependent oxidoreductase [Gemmatimonadota bacterium]
LFQPLLYQVATAALSPADIAEPIRAIVRKYKNVKVLLAEVSSVELETRRVCVGPDKIGFDWLVLAAGATHAYFGHDEWSQRAPGLKTVDDALEIRRRILMAFEEAELEEDDAARRGKLTFVVVGGGPTGVEMAGALREIAAMTIPADFRNVDTSTTRVVLFEGGPRLLASMSEEASERALDQLEALGVEVRLNTLVTDIDETRVWIDDQAVRAENVIWAAGVQGSSVAASLGVDLDGQGRVPVEPDCSLPGDRRVFVVGDLAAQLDARTRQPVPGVAQGAIQMGAFVGEIIRAELRAGDDHPPRPAFRYRDKGEMAAIGRARAVADIKGLTFGGAFAWLLWSLVHITFLVGFENKLLVMVQWAWQWIIQSRGARLITGSATRRELDPVDPRAAAPRRTPSD